MKIIIEKEPSGLYFAKIAGLDEVYAQGETLEEVIENLLSVYEEVLKIENQFKEI